MELLLYSSIAKDPLSLLISRLQSSHPGTFNGCNLEFRSRRTLSEIAGLWYKCKCLLTITLVYLKEYVRIITTVLFIEDMRVLLVEIAADLSPNFR